MKTLMTIALFAVLTSCVYIDRKINEQLKSIDKVKPAWIGDSPVQVPPIVNPPYMTTP